MSLIIYVSVLLCCLHQATSQSKCDYSSKEGDFMVKCDGRNYTNFPLASALPENSTVIIFKDNKIQQLPNQPHGVLRLKVWNIDLSGNIIDHLSVDKLGKAFPHVSQLDLSNNQIRLLSDNSFQFLAKLHVLYLSYNKLTSISQVVFHISQSFLC